VSAPVSGQANANVQSVFVVFAGPVGFTFESVARFALRAHGCAGSAERSMNGATGHCLPRVPQASTLRRCWPRLSRSEVHLVLSFTDLGVTIVSDAEVRRHQLADSGDDAATKLPWAIALMIAGTLTYTGGAIRRRRESSAAT